MGSCGPDSGPAGPGGWRWEETAAEDTWRDLVGPGVSGGRVRRGPDVSGGARRSSARVLPEISGERAYLYILGARSVQMRCSFRPHNRDPTAENMEMV